MKKPKAIFCWSGGKDSALALNRVLSEKKFEVVCLLTTINEHFKRISMHGVREELLEKQVASIGIPIEKMYVPQTTTNEEYGARMEVILKKYKEQGVEHVIFGDIFLEDLRKWREQNLQKVGLSAVFPIWKVDTKELIEEFVSLGFESVICCVNDGYLDEKFAGTRIDGQFLGKLPANVDACGENGEYHSFVYAGPIFKQNIPFQLGEKLYRPLAAFQSKASSASAPCQGETSPSKPVTKGFWFCDLVPQ